MGGLRLPPRFSQGWPPAPAPLAHQASPLIQPCPPAPKSQAGSGGLSSTCCRPLRLDNARMVAAFPRKPQPAASSLSVWGWGLGWQAGARGMGCVSVPGADVPTVWSMKGPPAGMWPSCLQVQYRRSPPRDPLAVSVGGAGSARLARPWQRPRASGQVPKASGSGPACPGHWAGPGLDQGVRPRGACSRKWALPPVLRVVLEAHHPLLPAILPIPAQPPLSLIHI